MWWWWWFFGGGCDGGCGGAAVANGVACGDADPRALRKWLSARMDLLCPSGELRHESV